MPGTFKELFGKYWLRFITFGFFSTLVFGILDSWEPFQTFIIFCTFWYYVLAFGPQSWRTWYEEATGHKPDGPKQALIMIGISFAIAALILIWIY